MAENFDWHKEKFKKRVWQGISVFLFLIIFLLLIPHTEHLMKRQKEEQIPQVPQPTKFLGARYDIEEDDDAIMGDKNAPVTIISFEDYQCPFCKRAFEQSVLQVKKDYIDDGRVRYIFRDFPLGFHPEAQFAAEASECAHEQGKFWEYHDALYENQQSLGSALYIQLAQQIGLDDDKFKTCIDTRKYSQEVKDDFSYGSKVGVTGTPTFFINGIKLVGAQPYQSFKQIIDDELTGG